MPKLSMTLAGVTRPVDLKPQENTLGRSVQNDIVLPSTFASRRHAVIVVEAAFTTIRDLGSQNGTFVNGVRVQTQVLVDGDVVTLGGCQLHFIEGDQEFSEVEARGLSSIPNWMIDDEVGDAPTARDKPFDESDERR